MSGRKL
jgi:hypothetical protein